MIWFWYFLFYSFVGFLLEVTFARLTGGRRERKMLLFLPLCPVYGLGACSIVWTAQAVTSPLLLFLTGLALASSWEYIAAAFYEDLLGISFWDYSDLPLDLHGRVCLPFSMAWGLLSFPLVNWLHPLIARIPFAPPLWVTALMLTALCADAVMTCFLLAQTGQVESLAWYRRA